MKILQVNQFYYLRGGAERYFLDLTRALENEGHEVAVFSMDHPKNQPSPWSRYFVSRISFNKMSLKDRLKTPERVLYSREAKIKFAELLRNFKPDIIHIHNIYHHISPSILPVAKKQGIPVVMHLHDYKLICPNQSLFMKGTSCEQCARGRYYKCLLNRCVKDSLAGSALATVEMYLHHSILKIYEKNIQLFIAPSEFMKRTMVRFGQEAEKIQVIYNPYSRELAEYPSEKRELKDYLLYFGRLTAEKGLEILIRAAALSSKKTIIAGSGPHERTLRRLAEKLKAPVEFLSFQDSERLRLLLAEAEAVVIPSIWAENMPLSLLEALSLGKIVIASRIGGLPEIIKDGENGLLFRPGDSEDLTRQIKHLADIDRTAISRAAQETSSRFSPRKNLEEIIRTYRQLIKNPD